MPSTTIDRSTVDRDTFRSGIHVLPENFWANTTYASRQDKEHTIYEFPSRTFRDFNIEIKPHEALVLPGNKPSERVVVIVQSMGGSMVTAKTITDYTKGKNHVCGLHALSLEQNIAFNLAMNPEIEFATIVGEAGSGKTIIPTAAAIHHVLVTRTYNSVLFIKEAYPVGEEIGFLSGDKQEKIGPWMGPLWDNLKLIADYVKSVTRSKDGMETLRSIIETDVLCFIAGRSIAQTYIIADEIHNLTRQPVKMIATRPSDGTKLICSGTLGQLSPEFTPETSGLTYLVEGMQDYERGAHIVLQGCKRSQTAAYASKHL